eukprot:1144359-Pelagomonas_calceolata.AAC.3
MQYPPQVSPAWCPSMQQESTSYSSSGPWAWKAQMRELISKYRFLGGWPSPGDACIGMHTHRSCSRRASRACIWHV